MIKVALLGFGVVGSGVAEVLTNNQNNIKAHLGEELGIQYILDLRDFPDSPFAGKIVHDFEIIRNDPEISVVVEMMGGAHPAYDFTKAALEAGKSVVTSNKQVVATYGVELTNLAHKMGVRYLFEASVGGGIPVIRPMMTDYGANSILSIDGILNGTTNYMLTRMKNEGISRDAVLRDAQAKGYAEKDPTADVEGIDAARKIVILAVVAWGKLPNPDAIHTEGISHIDAADVATAAGMGYSVKLIGHAEKQADGKILAAVAPHLVPASHPLSHIDDVFNGIFIRSDTLGDTMFYGRGAGKLPTAGAVVSDILEIARHPADACKLTFSEAPASLIAPFEGYTCRHYLTFEAPDDTDAAVAAIRRAFGNLAEHIHLEPDGRIVLVTSPMAESALSTPVYNTGLTPLTHLRILN